LNSTWRGWHEIQATGKSQEATDHATRGHWNEMNRKQRRDMLRKIQSQDLSLEVVHPDAAGIGIGNESHCVAVQWLKQCRIRTIAMQSTGVCWIGLPRALFAASPKTGAALSAPFWRSASPLDATLMKDREGGVIIN
jgi:hypothetical protein